RASTTQPRGAGIDHPDVAGEPALGQRFGGDGKLSGGVPWCWRGTVGGGRARHALGPQGISAEPAGGSMPRTRPPPLPRYRHRPQPVPCLRPTQSPPQQRPLYESVLTWVSERLATRGYPRPLCKRLALLVTGLVAGEDATLSEVTSTVHGLAI